MPTWMGWTATSAPVLKTVPTWNEWSAGQRRVLSCEKPPPGSIAFSDRELARLLFVRWLYQRGDLDLGLF